jgi:hypothetical protein
MIDGLPDELVIARSASGKVTAVSDSVQSGFLLDGCFYNRQEAAEYLQTASRAPAHQARPH